MSIRANINLKPDKATFQNGFLKKTQKIELKLSPEESILSDKNIALESMDYLDEDIFEDSDLYDWNGSEVSSAFNSSRVSSIFD